MNNNNNPRALINFEEATNWTFYWKGLMSTMTFLEYQTSITPDGGGNISGTVHVTVSVLCILVYWWITSLPVKVLRACDMHAPLFASWDRHWLTCLSLRFPSCFLALGFVSPSNPPTNLALDFYFLLNKIMKQNPDSARVCTHAVLADRQNQILTFWLYTSIVQGGHMYLVLLFTGTGVA